MIRERYGFEEISEASGRAEKFASDQGMDFEGYMKFMASYEQDGQECDGNGECTCENRGFNKD
jgi:hypothetical protein